MDLRAALYEAMVGIPGSGVEVGVENADRRPGLSVFWTDGHSRHDTIFDPADGAFIGERTTVSGPTIEFDLPVGTVTQLTAVSTAAVESLGVPPAAGAE